VAAGGVTREQVAERLRPLLELPVEVVRPTHGAPNDRVALECAIPLALLRGSLAASVARLLLLHLHSGVLLVG
jgi:hypothetical protein